MFVTSERDLLLYWGKPGYSFGSSGRGDRPDACSRVIGARRNQRARGIALDLVDFILMPTGRTFSTISYRNRRIYLRERPDGLRLPHFHDVYEIIRTTARERFIVYPVDIETAIC